MPDVPREAVAFLQAPGLAPRDVARRAFAVVEIVDQLVGHWVHPARQPIERDPPWPRELLNRLRRLGRFNPTVTLGSVIPTPHGRDRGERDPTHIGRRLRFTRPLTPYVLRYAFVSGLARPSAVDWSVAVIPVPHRADAARHAVVPDLAMPHYEIRHAYTDDDRRDIRDAVVELDARGDVPVVVFPEAALDAAGLEDISQTFTNVSGADSRRPGPGLQLLLVGHCGGEPGHNAFTVLKRGGITAWTQAKINSYNLRNDTIRRDKLSLPLLAGDDECYRERLTPSYPPTVTVADTPYGRLMIAVCEDLGHLCPSTETAVEGRVTHFIAPLLDKELKKGGWYDERLRALAREIQCTSIVCTSAFLTRRIRRDGDDDSAPVTVMLVDRPPWRDSKRPFLTAWEPRGTRLWVKDRCPSPPP
jgi:hypothetical protein